MYINTDNFIGKHSQTKKYNKMEKTINGSQIINIQDTNGETVLHSVAYNNNVHVLKKLLHLGANIGITNKDGKTPLHVACDRDSVEIIDELLDKIISATQCDKPTKPVENV